MKSFLSNIWLILYVSAWIVTIAVYQKKRKHFDAGSVLLCSYLLYSATSLLLYNSDNPFHTFNSISLLPFIYLYLMLMLAFSPILKYDSNKINEIQKPTTVVLNTVCITFIVASLIQIPAIISDFSVSILRLLTDSSGGQELYAASLFNADSIGDRNISNLASIISNTFGNFGILLLFYYLTLKNHSKLILIGLFLSCILARILHKRIAKSPVLCYKSIG